MKMLGGKYGEGTLTYLSFDRSLSIMPKNAWTPKKRSISEIIHFEDVNNQTSSSLGKAGIGAAAGFLLAGPLAGVLGMAMGASKGTSTQFVFGVGFSNGDAIMIAANSKDYMELKSAISPFLPKPKKIKEKPLAGKEKFSRSNKTSNNQLIILGREKLKVALPENPIVNQLNKIIKDKDTNEIEKQICKTALVLIEEFNIHKWRTFDKEMNQEEYKFCLLESCGLLLKKGDNITNQYWYYNKMSANSELRLAKITRERANWFNKSSIEQEAKKYEMRAERYLKKFEIEKEKFNQQVSDRDKYRDLFFSAKKTELRKIIEELMSFEDFKVKLNSIKGYSTIKRPTALKIINQNMPIEKENEKEKNIENQVGSIEDRIEKLNSLLDKKIITKTEYNKKRKDILSEL